MISADKIPNNVDLHYNKRLQRALEHWQPQYIQWWRDMGPQGFQDYHQVYVRTAVSVDPSGWAHFEYVRLPEYRWGIFLADPVQNRTIGFGDFFGQPVWQEVPGEFRNQLLRLIVTQGDTEPASVEQQRWLGHRCPSLYDMRNLFQVNVEEGRHLWAMVYLLHSYFGRDGRDEAEDLLARQSGNRDKPRILDAFNEPIDTWLDFFAFTMFTDRDGKSQLLSLSESSLDPLSRTTRFMLTEEAHHMFVGETGVARILERTCELMKEAGFSEDVRKVGGIDIPLDDHAVDRRQDLGELEVAARAVERDFGRLDVRARHRVLRLRSFKHALRDHAGAEECPVALVLLFGLGECRATALQRRARVFDRLLRQRRIDAREKLSLLHAIVEVHEDLRDLSRHLRADAHRLHRGQRSRRRDRQLHVASLHLPEPELRRLRLRSLVEPETGGGQDDHDDDENDAISFHVFSSLC